MKLKITPYHFEELIKQSCTLDQVYMLKMISQNIDFDQMMENSLKIKSIHQSLLRKGLIDEDTLKITKAGEDILNFLETPEKTKLVKRKVTSEEFDEWWKIFPGTDTFTYNGKKFTGSRGLKRNINECRIKFNRIIEEDGYSARDIIEATKLDVEMKKQKSYKTNENRLSFLQNSLTYLNQRSFEPFIDLLKEEMPQSDQFGATDI